MRRILYAIFGLAIFASCEDQIDLKLKDAPAVLVVDAWINDLPGEQVIKLNKSQPFFDASVPPGVSGATVVLNDSEGNSYTFSEKSAGEYVWNTTTNGDIFNQIGEKFTLDIMAEGKSYTAVSEYRRVPKVDSIKFTLETGNGPFQPDGYYGEFVSTDLQGPNDTYWIKAYKNGVYLDDPFELNIAYDAGFSAGGNIDGVVFIQPIQSNVTPFNDDITALVPYEPGDSLYVEVHSITNEAFTFLQQVQIQTQRDGGFDEIFAEPLENVPSNIINTNPNDTEPVAGFFNVSAVSGNGKRLVE